MASCPVLHSKLYRNPENGSTNQEILKPTSQAYTSYKGCSATYASISWPKQEHAISAA